MTAVTKQIRLTQPDTAAADRGGNGTGPATRRSSVCEICHRPLTNPDSVRRGLGPVCAGRLARNAAEAPTQEERADRLVDIPLEQGIYVWRQDGQVITNVPPVVTHHSPSGFEFGYGGSGPADLALNILENVLGHEGYRGPRTSCYRGDCFSLAYALHQEFKWQFIAPMDRDGGGTIGYQEIVNWIEARSTQVRELWTQATGEPQR